MRLQVCFVQFNTFAQGWLDLAGYQHATSLEGRSALNIEPLVPLATPTASIEASAIATAHTPLIVTKPLALIAAKIATAEILTLTALPLLGASILHASKHGAHSRRVHLAGVHAAAGHHLLHHLLHLGRHSLHPRHAAGGPALARSALATTGGARHHPWHAAHAHHHHVLHILHHFLVVGSDGIRIELLPHAPLLGGIECPGELVQAVVEVVGQICAGPPPWLVMLSQILIDVDLRQRLAGGLVRGDSIDVKGGGPDGGKVGAAGLLLLFSGGRGVGFLGRGFRCGIVGY